MPQLAAALRSAKRASLISVSRFHFLPLTGIDTVTITIIVDAYNAPLRFPPGHKGSLPFRILRSRINFILLAPSLRAAVPKVVCKICSSSCVALYVERRRERDPTHPPCTTPSIYNFYLHLTPSFAHPASSSTHEHSPSCDPSTLHHELSNLGQERIPSQFERPQFAKDLLPIEPSQNE